MAKRRTKAARAARKPLTKEALDRLKALREKYGLGEFKRPGGPRRPRAKASRRRVTGSKEDGSPITLYVSHELP